MNISPFDVVVVPFPYSDRLADKRRPALVISNSVMARELGRVWVAMITSVPATQIGDFMIENIQAAGLPVASTIRASKIATIDVARIIRVAGSLDPGDRKLATRALISCAGY